MATRPLNLDVQKFHRIGTEVQALRDEAGAKAGRGKKWVNTQAKKQGLRRHELRRALQLLKYYPGERKLQSLRGLTWTKVMLLLSIRDEEQRMTLQRQAKSLSYRDLAREVRKRKRRRRRRSNRLHQKLGTPRYELVKLEEYSRIWLSFASNAERRTRLASVSPGGTRLSELLGKAVKVMDRLIKRIERARPDPPQ